MKAGIKTRKLRVDFLGYLPEGRLKQLGEYLYTDIQTGTLYIQEPTQVIKITTK